MVITSLPSRSVIIFPSQTFHLFHNASTRSRPLILKAPITTTRNTTERLGARVLGWNWIEVLRSQNASHRIPLSFIRHTPKERCRDRLSEESRRKVKRKKTKVQYYYDPVREVMIRQGLYDEDHPAKHNEWDKKGLDLYRKGKKSSIWSRFASGCFGKSFIRKRKDICHC
jgi:hypothetical protein